MSGVTHITGLLAEWSGGDEQALDRLMPLVYAELRDLARGRMHRERADHILQPTALINELYLKLIRLDGVACRDRGHFFALCALMMRRILTDCARARCEARHGGGALHVAFDDRITSPSEAPQSWTALDDALDSLAAIDRRKCRVVELRFFGGLSVQQTAAALNVSPETVMRDWRLAKAWIRRELTRR